MREIGVKLVLLFKLKISNSDLITSEFRLKTHQFLKAFLLYLLLL